ncbi:hypothetical protein [Eoetvoesiella caeni]
MSHDAIATQICLGAGLDEQQADTLLTRLKAVEKAQVKALMNALKPFSDFYPSLVEWKSGGPFLPVQDAFPMRTPVLERTYPQDILSCTVCRIFVSDFRRAAQTLAVATEAA